MAKAKTYTGETIEIGFEMRRCIHARNCFLKLPDVFDPKRRPWVDPDAAPAEEIAAMIRTCPSGALTFRRLDSGLDEAPPRINRVQVLENGPLAVAGDVRVDGVPVTRATVCRCGQSANMPYCDYSHVKAAFSATGEPTPAMDADKADAPGAGVLEITTIADGPLRASGPMEVISGTGHRVSVDETRFLCRCGASKTKPYCDGSHKKTGFTG